VKSLTINVVLTLTQALLECGANPNRTTRTGNTCLRAAVLLGDAWMIRTLVERGADLDLETSRGTALVAACR
jgi:ankyrin repeat protein